MSANDKANQFTDGMKQEYDRVSAITASALEADDQTDR